MQIRKMLKACNSIARLAILAAIFCLGNSYLSHGQTIAHERCHNFKKGMNLSNWLEAYWQVGYPTPDGYSFQDLAKMKEAGITSIRLPLGFASVTDTVAPYYVDTNSALFARIDSVISWCDVLNMNLIIDNHHNWDIFNQNWRTKIDRFAHMWSVVSRHYKHLDPNRYTFELLNEPAFGIALDSLNIVMNRAIDSIRQHTTAHSIIVSPNFSSNGAAFSSYTPLADTNLIYTWHSYDPYQFTHQGFSWASPAVPLGETFPGSYDQGLYNAWATVTNWSATNNKPVFLGEFGTGVLADDVSRCNWLQVFGSKIDSFDMPWFYWDWRWDFALFNSNVVSADSVVPCFRSALHLYGDTLISSISPVVSTQPDIRLFPNPASANTGCTLVTNAEETEVIIYDIAGRSVFTQGFNGQIPLPITTFQPGIYLLKINSGKRITHKKLLIR
ncbi:MAG TPA: cellulase family glycosylhydrolase [Chitinophagales bacterium]|nr:cellulase family glycosylhydrolase [Chitinophagales bacterium]